MSGSQCIERQDDGVARVGQDIEELAKFSEAGDGVTRVAYTAADVQARAWFRQRCETLGLRFEVDRYGTCFGWSPGSETRPAVLLGSHLDSVREGGRYDGVLGVVVGFELARRLLAADALAPVAVVSFACEESTRFGIGAVGSRLLVGDLREAALDELRDLDGTPLRDVLTAAELEGAAAGTFRPQRVACFLEVHVDQGSGLADSSAVGVVPRIAGTVRTRIAWTGEVSHSGAHARSRRRNALLGAARFIVAAEELWAELDDRGDIVTITVGWLRHAPNAPNAVSGAAEAVVDLRAPEPGVLAAAQDGLERAAREIAEVANLEVGIEVLGSIEPVAMDADVVDALCRAAMDIGIDHRLMPSMAGHDAEVIAATVPSAMLFVANPAGVSHNPAEAIDEQSLLATIRLLEAAIPQLTAGVAGTRATTSGGA